MGKIVSHRV